MHVSDTGTCTSRLHNFQFFPFDFFSKEGFENANPTFQMPQKGREKQQQQHGKEEHKKAQEKPRDKTHKKSTGNIDFHLSPQV